MAKPQATMCLASTPELNFFRTCREDKRGNCFMLQRLQINHVDRFCPYHNRDATPDTVSWPPREERELPPVRGTEDATEGSGQAFTSYDNRASTCILLPGVSTGSLSCATGIPDPAAHSKVLRKIPPPRRVLNAEVLARTAATIPMSTRALSQLCYCTIASRTLCSRYVGTGLSMKVESAVLCRNLSAQTIDAGTA